MTERDAEVRRERRSDFRPGLNLGDIFIQRGSSV
jgi:hypothetical protein